MRTFAFVRVYVLSGCQRFIALRRLASDFAAEVLDPPRAPMIPGAAASMTLAIEHVVSSRNAMMRLAPANACLLWCSPQMHFAFPIVHSFVFLVGVCLL